MHSGYLYAVSHICLNGDNLFDKLETRSAYLESGRGRGAGGQVFVWTSWHEN